MSSVTSAEDILARIGRALAEKRELQALASETSDNPFFKLADNDAAVAFAKAFTEASGNLFYVTTEEGIKERLIEVRREMSNAAMACCNNNLTHFLAQLGFTDSFTARPQQHYPLGLFVCDALEAWNGSIVVSDRLGLGVNMRQLPSACVVIAFTSQLCADWREVLQHLQAAYPDALPGEIVSFRADDCKKTYLLLVEDQ